MTGATSYETWMAARNRRRGRHARGRLKSFQRPPGRHGDRMTQTRRILASHRKVVIALEARNPFPGVIVQRAAYSDRPVTEFVENALQGAQLPQRIDDVGDRVWPRASGRILRARTRQRNRIVLLRRFGRPTSRRLRDRSGLFAG